LIVKIKTKQMKKVDVVLGLQWGDEGKGKMIDVLTPNYEVVARFQGGPNAGHTLEFEGQKYVLRSIPSGIFQGGKVNIIGNGVVLDPILFKEEATALAASGHDLTKRLYISKKAHLILPTHRMLDAAYEAAKGSAKIGTTGKGIGPTYTDKISRNGVRVGDIFRDFKSIYAAAKARHEATLRSLNYEYDVTELEQKWFEGIEYLKQFNIIDSEQTVNDLLMADKSILAEGAQGTLLDVDFGSYPFVTSSNTVCAGACTGLGVAPNRIGDVYGIFKAYCTRVGSGPFPTELFDNRAEEIRERGHEYGTVTGRPRRVGWFDAVVARYTAKLAGIDNWALMLFDVLSGLDKVCICTGYECDGKIINNPPATISQLAKCKPVLIELEGWKEDISDVKSFDELPEAAKAYVRKVEEVTGVKVGIISVGADRSKTIIIDEKLKKF
jgi:adenylosuccinate synthase